MDILPAGGIGTGGRLTGQPFIFPLHRTVYVFGDLAEPGLQCAVPEKPADFFQRLEKSLLGDLLGYIRVAGQGKGIAENDLIVGSIDLIKILHPAAPLSVPFCRFHRLDAGKWDLLQET